MSHVVHRTTREHRARANTPDFPVGTWIISPDLSAVAGFATKYWIITGDVVTLMDQAARDAVDVAEAAASLTDARNTAHGPIGTADEAEGIRLRALIELLNKRDNFLTNRVIELQNRVQAMLNSIGGVANMRTDGLAVSISATATRTRADAITDYRANIDAGNMDAGE